MKRARHIAMVVAVTGVLVLAYVIRVDVAVERLPRRSGEQFAIGTMAADDAIVVNRLYAHHEVIARQYRLRRHEVVVLDADAELSTDGRRLVGKHELARHSLAPQLAGGLDATLEYFRSQAQDPIAAWQEFRIQYFRRGKQVGEEQHYGFLLTKELGYLRIREQRGEAVGKSEFEDLARTHGVPFERLMRLIPFESLESELPNQTVQPTPTAVTPRAKE